ncbi:MAG: signal peptidase II [Candidatus Gracilibacteria bacterium]|nr:signal peptidase II [Candidatus Gracilibacteria bacterium]
MSFVLIISGALGNAWERVFLGRVTDFIGVKYFSVFNLADTYITLGMIIYFVLVVFKKDK